MTKTTSQSKNKMIDVTFPKYIYLHFSPVTVRKGQVTAGFA